MNIIHIIPLFPPHLGGMENVTEQMCKHLAGHDRIVTVITSNIGYDSTYVDVKRENYKVERLSSSLVANLPIIWTLIPRLMRIPKNDTIIHAHIAQAFIPEIALLVAKLKRIPYIAHFHLDVSSSGRFGILFKAYKRFILPKTLRAASKVIVFSETQRQSVSRKYAVPCARIAVIPNAVENAFYYDKKRELPSMPTILFAGRLSPQKNVSQLLYALEGVSEKFNTLIVGHGELERDLKSLSSQIKLQNVTFAGLINSKDMLEVYKRSDIFVLPSQEEGMPLVLLEAMAMKMPIIATNVVGSRDVVCDNVNGFLVEYDDPLSLRQALLELCDNPKLYQKMSASAKKSSLQYSWKKIIVEIENEYKDAMYA